MIQVLITPPPRMRAATIQMPFPPRTGDGIVLRGERFHVQSLTWTPTSPMQDLEVRIG